MDQRSSCFVLPVFHHRHVAVLLLTLQDDTCILFMPESLLLIVIQGVDLSLVLKRRLAAVADGVRVEHHLLVVLIGQHNVAAHLRQI